jgi:aerotaxis receptor
MKINQPVTTTECFLQPGRPVVSKTDLQGRITYANESFLAISGFSRAELLGADHSIVRHPDMPPAAFADLWRTIKADQPWRGLVKNRTRSGDFYWVEAYVTPLTDQGRTIGYMSVRNTPARTDVAAAEALYAQARAGTAQIPQTPLPGRHLPPAAAWWIAALFAAALGLGAGAVGGVAGLAMGAAAALLALGMAGAAQVGLLVPLDALAGHMRALDEGRLADRVAMPARAHGALAMAFAQLEAMRIHLRAMFADVLISAGEVEARARKLDEAVRSLHGTLEQQGDRVSQVAAAMEQMSVSVTEISQNTAQGLEAAHRTEALAQSGIAVMAAGLESGSRMSQVVDSTQKEIAQVDQSVGRISEVTRIIRDIADQTNLLALNAAIEAARAGEQGRGFAVVADEVRKLSERTAQSTQHITAGVEDIVRQAHAAVATMGAASADVTESAARIRESSQSLDQIWSASREAARAAGEVTSMLQQQSVASHEVANAMELLSGTIEASSNDVAIVGTATAELRSTAEEMRLLVHHLETALH